MRKVFLLFITLLTIGTLRTFAQTASADSLLQSVPIAKPDSIIDVFIASVDLKTLPDSLKKYVKVFSRKVLKKAQVRQSMVKVDGFNEAISAYQTLADLLKPNIFTINADIVRAYAKIRRPQTVDDLSRFVLATATDSMKFGPYKNKYPDIDIFQRPMIAAAIKKLANIKLAQTVADLNQFVLYATADSLKFGPYKTLLKSDTVQQIAALNVPVIFSTPATSPGMSLASNDNMTIGIYIKIANANTPPLPFAQVTNADLQACLTQKIVASFDEANKHFVAVINDTVHAAIPAKMPLNISTLDKQIELLTNDSLRAAYYQKMANYYLKYDSISIRKTKLYYQEQALVYIMKALHSYSKSGDNNGLRISYNGLVKVYKDQKKYPQAKWFILQSNTISRQQNDTRNIISSLVELASIKMAIKDYDLAKGDLNEALSLSSANHFSKLESMVQASYATFYAETNDPKKAAAALKRHDAIEDSIAKADAARRLAALKAQDSTELAKKKLLTSAGKKLSKPNSAKKIASISY